MKRVPSVGEIVTLKGIRGQIRLLYKNAPHIAAIVFPQDIGYCKGRKYDDWAINKTKAVKA